jgi:HEAT repeat protein
MARRVEDETYPRRLRNLAAAVLLARNDDVGREYFRQQLEPLTVESVDALWLVGYVGVYGGNRDSELPDMSWAEELMIAALQNKGTLSRDAICRCNYIEQEKLVEVRELAVRMGSFPKILSNLKSKKALPVLIALVEENPPYIARSAITELGKFEDRSVEPLILRILRTHDDRFDETVTAASDLKMRSAFSIILEHLDLNDKNGGIAYGLNALADSGDVPVLRTKLKTLKSYRRAEMQLLILKLQPEDPVPELLKLLRDRKFLARSDVVFRLEELKDNRAVKDLINVLCTDPDAPMRTFAMRALGTIRTSDAIEGLIMGLKANYNNVEKRKISQSHDYKKEYQQRILEELKEITGKDFGTNTKEWRKWLTTAYHPR